MIEDLLRPQHLLLILLVVLIFFGPKKLPELGKGLAQGIRSFKDALKDTKEAIKDNPENPPGPKV
ncbi:MAG: twin-arginine translocase TatA/TatE family subunit [Bryobacteraceae bacterium]|jgi:sec-independent protein translocase protein TatA